MSNYATFVPIFKKTMSLNVRLAIISIVRMSVNLKMTLANTTVSAGTEKARTPLSSHSVDVDTVKTDIHSVMSMKETKFSQSHSS